MGKYYVVDTNVLIENPEIIEEHNVVILSDVIRELEKHKVSDNRELAYHARVATRYIDKNFDKIKFDFNDYQVSDERFDNNYVDNRIIEACKVNNYGLITNDLLLKFKGKAENIEVIECKKETIEYKGFKFVDLDENELAHFYENMHENIFDLYVNQYLIVRDKNKHTLDKYRWDGENHIKLKLPPKRFVKAENDLQECALDLLNDISIPIKIIAGTYGSGKTFLAVRMGVYHVNEKGHFSKIMVVRNPIGTGEAIGWLKGDKEDKTNDFFKPVIQNLDGGIFEAEQMIQRGQLIKEIPYYMKGITVDDSYMIVDEAEDLDVKLIKLIGTRLGKNSVIVFSGDYEQTEEKYRHNNGLLYAIDRLKGHPLVGIVVLDRDIRSEASKVFADM